MLSVSLLSASPLNFVDYVAAAGLVPFLLLSYLVIMFSLSALIGFIPLVEKQKNEPSF
jgi:hypothetical protein